MAISEVIGNGLDLSWLSTHRDALLKVSVDDVLAQAQRFLAPSALVTGAAGGVSGQTRLFTLGAGDPSSVDQAANFTFNIDWGDNTTQVVTGPVGITVGHVYAVTGTYVVRVTATDKDGVAGELSPGLSLSIVAAQTQGNDLVVGGTPGSEAFTFTPGAIPGTVAVGDTITFSGLGGHNATSNGASPASFASPAGAVVVVFCCANRVSCAKAGEIDNVANRHV